MEAINQGIRTITITPQTVNIRTITIQATQDIIHYAKKTIKDIKDLQRIQGCCFAEGYRVKDGYQYGPQEACNEIIYFMRRIVSNPVDAQEYANEALEAMEYIRECQDCGWERGADYAFGDAMECIEAILNSQ